MDKTVKWGIIGTGGIAGVFARSLAKSTTSKLIAVGSRSQKSADAFGDALNVPHRYGSYTDLINDKDVDVIYITTPHSMHKEWAVKAAYAGKHILCEKPLTINYKEAAEVIEAAQRNNVFLMEGFMYRCHPQTEMLIELLRKGVIGDIRTIHTTFGFHCPYDPEHRIYKHSLGGGGILDVGGYAASMTRLIAGVVQGKNFENPSEIKGCGYIGKKSRVDEYTTASLKFPGDIIAQLSIGICINMENIIRIYGAKGNILVPSPWAPSPEGGTTNIIIKLDNEKTPQIIPITTNKDLFTIEADIVAENINNRQAPHPAMSWDDTLGNMKTLDMWRESIGMVYDMEK